MDSITITISPTDAGGYMYEVYQGDLDEAVEAMNEGDSSEGGHCTTTLANALGMAADAALTIIKREKGDECPGCGDDTAVKGGSLSKAHPEYGLMCFPCIDRMTEEGDFIGAR